MLMIREGARRVNERVAGDASQERGTDGAMMEQNAGLATPKIVSLDFTPLEYVLPREKAYGMARGLNFRRTVALVTVTADDGSVGHGEALGPLAPIGEYLALLRPFFVGRSIFDFELIAAQIYNRLYHFGVQGHHTAALSAINIALADAIGQSLGVPVHDLLGGRSADRIPCYATTGYLTNDSENDFETQLGQVDKKLFAGVKFKIGVSPQSDLERVRIARRILGDDILLMVDINGNYTPDVALESLRRIAPTRSTGARSRCRRPTCAATPNCVRARRYRLRPARRSRLRTPSSASPTRAPSTSATRPWRPPAASARRGQSRRSPRWRPCGCRRAGGAAPSPSWPACILRPACRSIRTPTIFPIRCCSSSMSAKTRCATG